MISLQITHGSVSHEFGSVSGITRQEWYPFVYDYVFYQMSSFLIVFYQIPSDEFNLYFIVSNESNLDSILSNEFDLDILYRRCDCPFVLAMAILHFLQPPSRAACLKNKIHEQIW